MKRYNIIKLSNMVDKAKWVSKVWNLLEKSYSKVEGGLLFEDEVELIKSTSIWKIVIRGNEIVAVTVFKQKYGQKLVAMATNSELFGSEAKDVLAYMLKNSLNRAWMEVSEAVEVFVMKYCGGEEFLINCEEAKTYLKKSIEPLGDGYHYIRDIHGIRKTKLLLGTPGYY